MPSPDLDARQLLMSAHLYYDRGVNVLSDAEYDTLGDRVADHMDAGLLDPFRMWQLGSAEEIRASGMGVKITQATVAGAESWYRHRTRQNIRGDGYSPHWTWNEEHQVHWTGLRG